MYSISVHFSRGLGPAGAASPKERRGDPLRIDCGRRPAAEVEGDDEDPVRVPSFIRLRALLRERLRESKRNRHCPEGSCQQQYDRFTYGANLYHAAAAAFLEQWSAPSAACCKLNETFRFNSS